MGAIGLLLRSGRSMFTLLTGILLFHAGWYLVLPFVAILFTSRRGLSPAQVGLLLAVQSFALLIGSLAGGWLADRWGERLSMVAGLLLRGLGLAALGIWPLLPTMLVAAGAAGLGGGLYGPAAKAGIAELAAQTDRSVAFAARGIAANIGTSIGPLLGGLLIRGPLSLLFGAAAVLHLGLAALTWALYRDRPKGEQKAGGPWWGVLTDRGYIAFSLATAAAWALFSQLAIAMPLHARQALGLESAIGLLWTAISLTVILLQFSVTRLATRYLSPLGAMAWGALLLGAGLGLVGQAGSFGGLLAAVLLFVAGEMLLMPTADSLVSTFAGEGALGSYFGIATVAWGLGEGVGNLVGGRLVQAGLARPSPWIPWGLYVAAGVVIGGLYFGMRQVAPADQQEQPPADRQEQAPADRPAGAEAEWALPPPGSAEALSGILLQQEPGPDPRQEEG